MKVGDRIMRKSNLEGGCILAARKNPSGCYMVCVAWDSTAREQWLPSEEIRPWDKLQSPPEARTTPWGRTTPGYLVALRRDLRINGARNPARDNKRAQNKLADELVKLSNRKKAKSKNKARKLISKHETDRATAKKLYQQKSGDYSY